MVSLENGLQPHSGVTPLFSIRTESLMPSLSSRSIDANIWCKRALREDRGRAVNDSHLDSNFKWNR